MLPLRNRLKSRQRINELFQSGKTIAGRNLFLRYQVTERTFPKISFAISKKMAPLASSRNRIKRLLAGVASADLKKNSSGVDLVVGLKRPLPKQLLRDEKFRQTIKTELSDLLKKSTRQKLTPKKIIKT